MNFDMTEFDFNMDDAVDTVDTLNPLTLDIPNIDNNDAVMDLNLNDRSDEKISVKSENNDTMDNINLHMERHLSSADHQFLVDTPEHTSFHPENNQSQQHEEEKEEVEQQTEQQIHVQHLQHLQQQQHDQMLNLEFEDSEKIDRKEEDLQQVQNSLPDDSPNIQPSMQRSNSTSNTNASSPPKRTRASGEILRYLIDQFNLNSNPSSAQRKEISEKTGMPERSVRIWFQNRRAKARKQGKMEKKDDNLNEFNNNNNDNNNDNNNKDFNNNNNNNEFSNKFAKTSNSSKTNSPFNLPTSNLVEVNNKYYIMECKNLSIGNWQRIKAGYITKTYLPNLSPQSLIQLMSTTDLVVILSKKDAELNYFFSGVFQNEKVLFRIFYPVRNIIKCSLLNQTDPKNATLNLELSHSPQFAVHFTIDPNTGEPNVNQWSICEDFSEGQQVTNAHYSINGSKIPHILHDDVKNLKFMHTLITSIIKNLPKESFTPIINSPAKIDTNLDLFNSGGSNDFETMSDLIPNNMMINDKDFLLDEFQ
ncbi:hypothetical protein CANINC_004050 [Pichia inconspicua]|uniref:Homeobox domain-containing protein n=1 Tax=Pichia inconspicua TaxID=52247 RepID=A0A4T0WYI3_9ASCO|nr:hypothetical protein CANINC_004050 [[Candida] inconspicua]